VNLSSGNKERDDLISRTKALLKATGNLSDEEEAEYGSPGTRSSSNSSSEDERIQANVNALRSSTFDQEIEDGVAPLGGEWPSGREKKPKAVQEMLNDPMNNLHGIHDEAARQLKVRMLNSVRTSSRATGFSLRFTPE
jgi:hypothetical protein